MSILQIILWTLIEFCCMKAFVALLNLYRALKQLQVVQSTVARTHHKLLEAFMEEYKRNQELICRKMT